MIDPQTVEWTVSGREFAELAKKVLRMSPSSEYIFYQYYPPKIVEEATSVVMKFFDMFSEFSEDSQGLPQHKCKFCVSVNALSIEDRRFWAGRKFWVITYLHRRDPLRKNYMRFFINVGNHLRVDIQLGEILSLLGNRPLREGTSMKFAVSKEAAKESSPMIAEVLKSLCPWACIE